MPVPDPRDQLDLSTRPVAQVAKQDDRSGRERKPQAYLRVWFECSRQYARAQRTPDSRAYQARCPTCAKTIRFAIGPGGTSERFFRVSC